MVADNQRKLVDGINKNTILGKMKWELIPGIRSGYRHPDAEVDYFYVSAVGQNTFFLYRTSRSNKPSLFSGVSSAIEGLMGPAFLPETFFVTLDQSGEESLVIKGDRFLSDLFKTVQSKTGSPETVAADILKDLEQL